MKIPQYIQKIMKEVVILRAEMEFCRNAMRYEAWSEHFRCLPEGERLPEYGITFRDESVVFKEEDADGYSG